MTGEATSDVTLARLLSAFSFAADLAFGLELDDGLRATYIADGIARQLGLPEQERETVYYTALLKDAGCTCWTSELADLWQTNEIEARRDLLIFGGGGSRASFEAWVRRYVGAGLPSIMRDALAERVFAGGASVMEEGFAGAAEVCERFARRLGLPHSVEEASASLLEQWDGGGFPSGVSGEAIPVAARVVLPTYFLAPVHRSAGRRAACDAALAGRGRAFDPAVVDAFLTLAEDETFWQHLEKPGLQAHVYDLEPELGRRDVSEATWDAVAYAFADFIDLKSPFVAAHSRRVARVAEQLGTMMDLSLERLATVRRGALMHDLGLVAIPSRLLNRPESDLTPSEAELLRLHPYHGERILNRVPQLASLLPIVGGHHERMDGSGYFRGSSLGDLPLETRIVAVANRLDDLTHATPGSPAVELDAALACLAAEAGTALDRVVVNALVEGVGATAPGNERPNEWPAGLTNREVEVLRLAAKGLKRREIAGVLSITENTVRHHLEHIYNKTGTSTRVGATLFAMENNLLL